MLQNNVPLPAKLQIRGSAWQKWGPAWHCCGAPNITKHAILTIKWKFASKIIENQTQFGEIWKRKPKPRMGNEHNSHFFEMDARIIKNMRRNSKLLQNHVPNIRQVANSKLGMANLRSSMAFLWRAKHYKTCMFCNKLHLGVIKIARSRASGWGLRTNSNVL